MAPYRYQIFGLKISARTSVVTNLMRICFAVTLQFRRIEPILRDFR